jgi:hypothetical protein
MEEAFGGSASCVISACGKNPANRGVYLAELELDRCCLHLAGWLCRPAGTTAVAEKSGVSTRARRGAAETDGAWLHEARKRLARRRPGPRAQADGAARHPYLEAVGSIVLRCKRA